MNAAAKQRSTIPGSHVRRIKRAVVDGFAAPEYGTELALMHYRGELTRPQYDAAQVFLRVRAEFVRAVDARQIKSPKLEFGIGGRPPDPDSEIGQKIAEREKSAVHKFRKLERAAMECGRASFGAFWTVAIDDAYAEWAARLAVARVCEALRVYLERGRRSRRTAARAKS